ncbi:MAG: DUF4147 domain-containing protein [Hyphomicrobiales bacterium]|nr:DUF4147 domain-containing protein [Hyphomicrobiales bacterium]
MAALARLSASTQTSPSTVSSHSNAEWTNSRARTVLRRLFETATASANPRNAIANYLPPKPKGRCVVVGAGKAAAAMATAIDAEWPDVDLSGVVITRVGNAIAARRIEVVETGYPIPDNRGLEGARRILSAVSGLSNEDLVITVVSDGGANLLPLPAGAMTLADEHAVFRALLIKGAPYTEIRVVRKHLSAIKGGRLAYAARPAHVTTLVVTDIPRGELLNSDIVPTIPDLSTRADALAIVDRWSITLPRTARAILEAVEETVKPGEIAPDVRMVSEPSHMLEQAANFARSEGLTPLILANEFMREGRELEIELARIARSVANRGYPVAPPAVLLSSGERDPFAEDGLRHPNKDFLLRFAIQLSGAPRIWAIAGSTDGADGPYGHYAGAIIAPDTLDRARHINLDASEFIENNDTEAYFGALGDLIRTDANMSYENDFRAVLIGHETA